MRKVVAKETTKFYNGGKDMKENSATVNRKYKDRLFRLIFNNKKDLLDLYNAVNGTGYTNEEELIINTIDDVVYMGIKNDLSFIVRGTLNLYEHQSTVNKNMPLRGFLYISDVIQGLVETQGLDIYGSSQIKLPAPRYLVFYNGTQKQPDRLDMFLSEAFEPKDKNPGLEFRATMLNINLGHNHELKEKCKRLKEYAEFVDSIRREQKSGKSLKEAVETAETDCISRGVLSDILTKNRGEVLDVILTEYNEKRHIDNEKRLSLEEGLEEGLERGIRAFILDNLEEGIKRGRIIEKLQRHFELTEDEAEQYYMKYTNTK